MIVDVNKKLSTILKFILNEERKVDTYRQILFEQEEFSPLSIFLELDRDKKNFLIEMDIINALREYKNIINEKQIKNMFLFYDLDGDGKFSFEEFLLFISPSDNNYEFNRKIKEINQDVKYSFFRIVESEINFLIKFELLLKEINEDKNIHAISNLFKILDKGNKNYISQEDLYEFMMNQGCLLKIKWVNLLFKKLDINQDHKIDFYDFKFSFTFYYCSDGFSISNSYLNINPNTLTTRKFDENIKNQSFINFLYDEGLKNQKTFNLNSENIFIEFVKQTLINEREIEGLKIKLSDRLDFILNDFLILFRYENTQTVTIDNFKKALALFGVYENINVIEAIFKRFSNSFIKDNLSLDEFLNIILPFDDSARKIIESRQQSTQNYLIYDQNIFNFETRYLIKNIFQSLFNSEKIRVKFCKEMYIDKNFSIKDLFEKMSISKKNYILKEDIERYLKSNRIYYNEKDLLLVFKNLDMNQDGKVSYSEFSNQLIPLY